MPGNESILNVNMIADWRKQKNSKAGDDPILKIRERFLAKPNDPGYEQTKNKKINDLMGDLIPAVQMK